MYVSVLYNFAPPKLSCNPQYNNLLKSQTIKTLERTAQDRIIRVTRGHYRL